MYKIYVRHYGEQKQTLESTFKRRYDAERFLLQQGEILKGYFKRTMILEGAFIVIGKDEEGDFYQTRMWVGR